jgi:hypothetical protein
LAYRKQKAAAGFKPLPAPSLRMGENRSEARGTHPVDVLFREGSETGPSQMCFCNLLLNFNERQRMRLKFERQRAALECVGFGRRECGRLA